MNTLKTACLLLHLFFLLLLFVCFFIARVEWVCLYVVLVAFVMLSLVTFVDKHQLLQ